jgi:NADPH oxidase 2
MSGLGLSADLKPSERSRWPPLTRMMMSGDIPEGQKPLVLKDKIDRW